MTRRRVVVIGVLVALVGILTFRYVLWVDVGERCYLFIRVSLVGYDNTAVKRALQTLKHGSPEDYRKVCTHVATINPNPSCGGFGGGCFWHDASQRGRASIDVSTEHGLPWTIASIVLPWSLPRVGVTGQQCKAPADSERLLTASACLTGSRSAEYGRST